MAGKLSAEDDEPVTDINIVPLVDVALVTLIIFMVTATTIASPSIKVTLPDAVTAEAQQPTSLGIMVLADNSLLLDGKPVSEPDLRAAVRVAHAADADVVCLIAGDRDAKHGTVTHVMDLVKQEGVAKFAINIEPISLPVQTTGSAP